MIKVISRILLGLFVPQQQTAFPSRTPTASPVPVTPTPTLSGPTTSTGDFRSPLSASHTPPPTHTPTQIPTPLPERVQLTGVRHTFQTWNNYGPATLAMALSFWGWQGDQATATPFLKPLPRDKLEYHPRFVPSLSQLARLGVP